MVRKLSQKERTNRLEVLWLLGYKITLSEHDSVALRSPYGFPSSFSVYVDSFYEADLEMMINHTVELEMEWCKKDWGKLMRIVEFIERKVIVDGMNFGVTIYGNICQIAMRSNMENRVKEKKAVYYHVYEAESKIEAVWEAIVLFAKWFNKLEPKLKQEMKEKYEQ
jgi:hypothetical protein